MDPMKNTPVRLLMASAIGVGLLVAACSGSSGDAGVQQTLPADQPPSQSTDTPEPTPTMTPVPTVTASPVPDSRTQVLAPPKLDSEDTPEEALRALDIVRTGLKTDLDDLFGMLEEVPQTEGIDKERQDFFETDRLKRAISEISRTLDQGIWSMEFDSGDGKWTLTAKYDDSKFSEVWLVHDGTGAVEGPFYAESQ